VTEGIVEAKIESGVAATVMLIEAEADCAGLPLSLTEAVIVAAPLAVVVPEIKPVEDARLSPAGSLPELIDHV